MQSPLPEGLDEARAFARIDPAKDVDGFHPESVGQLVLNRPGLRSCTPAGVIELLDHYEIGLEGREVVVVGRSNIVGKPVALLALHRNATVTIVHSRTRDLPSVTRRAEVLIVAIGRPRFVTADMVAPGRRRDRRRHQPHRRRHGRRRRLRARERDRERDHAGAGRHRADDDRDAALEHAAGGARESV